MEQIITQLQSVDGKGVSVESTEFNGTNMLSNLKLMQGNNETVARRNDVAAQLMAGTLDKLSSNLGKNLNNYLAIFAQVKAKKDLQLSLTNLELGKYLDKNSVQIESANYIQPTLTIDDRAVSPSKYPAYNMTTQTTINADLSTSHFAKVKFPAIESIKDVGICLPTYVVNLKVTNLTLDKYRISEAIDRRCVIMRTSNETEVALTWDVLAIASSNNSQYNLNLGLFKQSGVGVVSDYEIRLNSGLQLITIDPAINLESAQTIFTENMTADRFINILLKKK